MTKMKEFKVGDKVYCPTLGKGIIYTLDTSLGGDEFIIRTDNGSYCCVNKNGRLLNSDLLPCIFHATVENHRQLEALYGVEFEVPKRLLKGSELCRHLLKTRTHVFCRVSNLSDEEALMDNARIRCIEASRREVGFTFEVGDVTGATYNYAVPINPDTLELLEMEVDNEY